jgi:hypothetical protein
MESKLSEIRSEFDKIRDEMDPAKYAPILRQLLDLPEDDRDKHRSEYFEALEEVLHMVFLSYGGGTPADGDRERIFDLLKANFKLNHEDEARASMQSLAGLLRPHPGVKEWFISLAAKEMNPERKTTLLKYANTIRKEIVI